MSRADFLEKSFLDALAYEPTQCQRKFLRDVADFVTSPDHDILVTSGYAGTGKTTALASVVSALESLGTKCILLAPTGRSAKVLSSYAGKKAYTIHKHIYRQKSVGGDGFGQFSLAPNKAKNSLFVVDEVSLLGIGETQQQSSAAFGTGNLLGDLVDFVRSGAECRLMLVGDSAQLPPIGLDESPALSPDYMNSTFNGVMFSSLTTVVRQARESGILHNATIIRKLISSIMEGSFETDELQLELDGFDDISVVMGTELIDAITEAYSKYGDDETIILTRSNKRAIRYNAGIRSQVQFKEDRLVKGDRLMVVKNCYQFLEDVKEMDYIANGDILKLQRISNFEERYGLQFATAKVSFPDYGDVEIRAKVILDTLDSESPSLTYEQSNQLYQGVDADYSWQTVKKKRYELVREDPYYNALQLKYSNAITCHKSQGGQWECVFIDNAFWQDGLSLDDLKWLYTALTRATKRVYLVNYSKLKWPVG
ncbi:MAG: AAA family ATPase [Bacteroidales bacterium]|nr:AAA family ATPase [Bacteroidales bacterium]